MFKVRRMPIDLAEMGSENTVLSPCFGRCCTLSYHDLNIVASADSSCDKAKSISEVSRVT